MASGDGTISITTGGKTSNIEVSSTMTVTEFVSKLQEAGVSASYDSGNNRLHISSKKSGKDNDFSLTATDANGLSALKSMGVYVPSDAGDKIYNEWKDYAVYQADGVTLDEAATKQKFADILDTIAKYHFHYLHELLRYNCGNPGEKYRLKNGYYKFAGRPHICPGISIRKGRP